MGMIERRTSAGLRVMVEEIPSALTAAGGFFVSTGSRDETKDVEGVSHFLEHMAFKATKKRSAIEVSRALDAMGSRANAYTSWERTIYYAQVLPEFIGNAVELIAEMIDPGFLQDDFDTEKKVILEEIEMYNDRPEFLLFEELMKTRYPSHSLAGRILGTRESITALELEQMKAYHRDRYAAARITLAVSGAVLAEDIFAIAERLRFSESRALETPAAPKPGAGASTVTRAKDTQEHFLASWSGPKNSELKERYAASVTAILLGDEEGSRFSWALLHPGIVESVDAGNAAFRDTGLFYAGFSAAPANFSRAREILFSEIEAFRRDGPAADELERAKTKYASRTVLASESTMARMQGMGEDALDGLDYRTPEEELAMILAVNRDDVMKIASQFEETPVSAMIGPLS